MGVSITHGILVQGPALVGSCCPVGLLAISEQTVAL